MKRTIYLSFLLLLFVVVGCQKDRDVALGERPEERMKAALDELRSNILDAENGWKAELTTAAGNGFSFYFDFNDRDRVVMVSDIDDESSSTPFESGYRLRAVMAASLLFDTYSYIHLLADPNPSVAGGVAARGYSSDFEFEYNGVSQDSLVLVGKKRRSRFYMSPATGAEKTQYLDGTFKDKIADFNAYTNDNPNLYFEISTDIKPAFLFNIASKKAVIAWKEGNADKFIEVPYVYTLTGVRFPGDAVIGNDRLSHIDLLSPTSAKAVMSNRQEYNMGNHATPLLPLSLIFNFNGVFKVIGTQSDQLPSITGTSNFTTAWNTTSANLLGTGRNIRYYEFVMSNSNTMTFNLYYSAGASNFTATVTFGYTYEDGMLTLRNPSGHTAGNWNTRIAQLRPLNDYLLNLANNQIPLRVEWVPSSDGSVVGGLVSTDDPNDILYGLVW